MTWRRGLSVIVVWLVLTIALAITNSRPAVVALLAIVAAVSLVVFAVIDLASSVEPVEWPVERAAYRSRRGTDPRISSLRHQLYHAERFGSADLHATLVALVDDRLGAHHHVDRGSDPARAAALLSPTLVHLVAGPDDRDLRDPRRLDLILRDIEAL